MLAGSSGVAYAAPGDERWEPIENGPNEIVYAMTYDGNGNLYIGGGFTMVNDIPAKQIAKWTGVEWSALGSGTEDGRINTLVVGNDGSLYVSGTFDTMGGVVVNNIAKWDGIKWSAIGGGLEAWVTALAIDRDNNLYAGSGSFVGVNKPNTICQISKWDGFGWHILGSVMDQCNVNALIVDNDGNLLASFWNQVHKWNGVEWIVFGEVEHTYDHIDLLAIDGAGNLYAAGAFDTMDGITANNIAKWNGVEWSALGPGVENFVNAIALDRNGNVYVAGAFHIVDGLMANHIAKWDGIEWSTLGSGLDNSAYAVVFDNSDTLYVGGGFGTAGNKVSPFIAKYLIPDEEIIQPDDDTILPTDTEPDESADSGEKDDTDTILPDEPAPVDTDTVKPTGDGCGCSVLF